MKIAILSDTHNQDHRVELALALARDRGAEMVLHCGDIEDPPVVRLFRGWNAHFVLGNCDWDRDGLREAITSIGGQLHDRYGHLEVAGRQLAFLHGHDGDLLHDLVQSGAYDYLFHGHTHHAVDRQAGPTRVINPGALQRARVKTFVVLDPASGVAETVTVE
ncbi:MAG: YfcE family phosphodiesterase [Gemmataceae bacterium]